MGGDEKPIIVDEKYLEEWIEWGRARLDMYLKLHADFEAYCERRDIGGEDAG